MCVSRPTNGFTFDANGNQIISMDALGHSTTNVFDPLNRVVEMDYADGTKTLTGYDAAGRRVAETNQDTIVTRFGYDGAGRLVAVTNAYGVTGQQTVTQYQYDEAGNQTAQIDALIRTTSFAFDSMGRRTKRTLPGTQFETMGYDLAGNLIRTTDFNGVVITNQYDQMNRLTNRASVGGCSVNFAYSPTGQRTNMTDPIGSTGYFYDTRDRLTNKVVSWSGGPVVSLSYLYDRNGNVTNIWSSTIGGVNLQYQLDPLNRITNVLAGGAVAAAYGFDVNGNLRSARYGNGATNLYQYDALNRLTNSVWKSNQVTLASFYYQLGANGNRTNLTETLLTSVTNRAYAWTYDSLYRLTAESLSGVGSASYGLDKVGNRTNRTAGLDSLPAQNFAYSANDWVTTNAYDSNGNTLWSTNGAAATGPYLYDAENRLTNFNNAVFFGYNGDGARVKKTVSGITTFYLLDDRNPTGYAQVLEEWTASGGTTNLSRVYSYGLALVSQVSGSTVYYFVPDGHGSTRLLTDGSGSVANAFAFDAHGTLISSNVASQTAYLYCGEQFDSDLGFYYLRARYLSPNTGRFWTMDTFEGSQIDPLSLHKYLYCYGDPLDRTDPKGKDAYVIMIDGRLGHTCFALTSPSGGVRVYHFYARGHSGIGGWFAQDRGLIYDTVNIWSEDWPSVNAFIDDKFEDGSDVRVEAIAAGTATDDKRMFDFLNEAKQADEGYYSFLGGSECYSVSWAWFRKYSNWNAPVDVDWKWNGRIARNGGPPLVFLTEDFSSAVSLPFMP